MKPSRDIARLIEIMAALRTPGTGCPWDLEQNFATIAPYTLEEAYEVADAIARGDIADLARSLATCSCRSCSTPAWRRSKAPSISATWSRPSPKADAAPSARVRRGPRAFAPRQVKGLWDRIKAEEKAERAAGAADAARRSALAGVPVALPALTRALKLQAKAGKVGFDWNDPRAVLAKIREECDEIEAEIDAGDRAKARGRGRRSAVRRGQPRAPSRRRSGGRRCAPPTTKFERRFPLDRAGAGRARQAAAGLDAGRDGCALGRRRRRRRKSAEHERLFHAGAAQILQIDEAIRRGQRRCETCRPRP